jgi:hypothetical protein
MIFWVLLPTTFFMDNGIEIEQSIPPMNLCVQVAMLKGLPVDAYKKLSHHAQRVRRSWHLEVDSKYVVKMKGLVQYAKEYGCVEEVWGCHAHLSKVMDAKSTASEAKQQADVVQAHTNYQLSMVAKMLVRVTNLDKPVNIINPTTHALVGSLSLRMVLLNYLKMRDGYPMIVEVHQQDLCKLIHDSIPHAKEAERMIEMMNKKLPAFLHHMLLKADFPEDFVKKLIKELCKASLVAEISSCKWDGETRILTTVANEKHEKGNKTFEGVAWFKDEFGSSRKGPNLSLVSPKELFNLDSSDLVETIHDHHQVSILKKASIPPTKRNEGEVHLTHEETDGDSASHSSSSSSSKDNDASNEGSHSKNSIKGKEDMSATGSK